MVENETKNENEITVGRARVLRIPRKSTTQKVDKFLKEIAHCPAKMPLIVLIEALKTDALVKGKLCFNTALSQVCWNGRAMEDVDYTELRCLLASRHGYKDIPKDVIYDGVARVAKDNSFNPVKDYLEGCTWDGVERLVTIPERVLNVKELHPLYGRYVECWMISAVARVFEPGCKVDTVLALNGPQGTYKSTFLSTLASGPGDEYFTSSPIEVGTKDAFQIMAGKWIIEWAELEACLHGKRVGDVKNFLTSRVDSFRPAYAHSVERFPRRCVIAASSNEAETYNDTTGNRRFFTIPNTKIDIDRAQAERDQWWGEAVTKYKQGKEWWVSPEEFVEQEKLNQNYARGADLRKALQSLDAHEDSKGKYILSSAVADIRETHGASHYTISQTMRNLGYTMGKHYHHGNEVRVWRQVAPTGNVEVSEVGGESSTGNHPLLDT